MRVPRPRVTVRLLMMGVFLAAFASWLGISAIRVALDPGGDQISHLRLRNDTRKLLVSTHPVSGTFWPRYRRRLLGQPWPGDFVCPSCRESEERKLGVRLIDIESGDAGRMMDRMAMLEQEYREIQMQLNLKKAANRAASR